MAKKKMIIKDYHQIKIPSHLLDSLWLRNDGQGLKIIFATGFIATFEPVQNNIVSNLIGK